MKVQQNGTGSDQSLNALSTVRRREKRRHLGVKDVLTVERVEDAAIVVQGDESRRDELRYYRLEGEDEAQHDLLGQLKTGDSLVVERAGNQVISVRSDGTVACLELTEIIHPPVG